MAKKAAKAVKETTVTVSSAESEWTVQFKAAKKAMKAMKPVKALKAMKPSTAPKARTVAAAVAECPPRVREEATAMQAHKNAMRFAMKAREAAMKEAEDGHDID